MIETTFKRKKRSSRNWPSATACSRAVGRRDDADIDPYVVLAAEPGELAVLEHLQQLGLERRRHLANLVEEHGAVVGELELAGLLAGSRPVNAPRSKPNSSDSSSSAGSAAQFTLTNGLSRRSEEREQRPRHKLLAGAALAANEDGERRCRRRDR